MVFLGITFDLGTAMRMLGFLGLMLCRLRVTCCYGITSSSSHAFFMIILKFHYLLEVIIMIWIYYSLDYWIDIAKI